MGDCIPRHVLKLFSSKPLREYIFFSALPLDGAALIGGRALINIRGFTVYNDDDAPYYHLYETTHNGYPDISRALTIDLDDLAQRCFTFITIYKF